MTARSKNLAVLATSAGMDLNTVEQQLTLWLKQAISNNTRLAIDDINTEYAMIDYGLDSVSELEIVGALSEWLKQDLLPYVLYQHATLAALITCLTQTYLKNHHGE